MKTIRIPVQNSVEVIVADIFVNVDIQLNPQCPIQTVSGKIAFEELQTRLRYYGHKIAKEILDNCDA